MKTLKDFYLEHKGKVSDKWNIYLEEYNRIFEPFRSKNISLLEIGVQNGGSLEIWEKYFPNAVALVGSDINTDCEKLTYQSEKISLVVADANTDHAEHQISMISEQYDIIIDDGSHTSKDIVQSFSRYFPHLKNGGIYIAEDLHCSYWGSFGGGLHELSSSISFFKQLVDVINYEHWGLDKNVDDVLELFKETYGFSLSSETLNEIHSIEFINSLCVIRKFEAERNSLGSRNVSGELAEVVDLGDGYRGMQPEVEWQKGDERSVHPHYRIRDLEAQVSALKTDYGVLYERSRKLESESRALEARTLELIGQRQALQGQVSELQAGIEEIYQSTSWRYSRPVRFVGRVKMKGKRIATAFIRLIKLSGGVFPAIKKVGNILSSEGRHGILTRYRSYHGVPSETLLTGGQHQSEGANPLSEQPIEEAVDYASWMQAQESFDTLAKKKVEKDLERLSSRPLISIVMPTFNPNLKWLAEAIDSVSAQLYGNWELCIADDHSTEAGVVEFLHEMREKNPRIKVVIREENGHISVATNSALALASGEWVALMDQDDLLTEDALYEMVKAISRNPNANLIYSDEDNVDEVGKRTSPLFKPDWSPHLALSQAYIGHLCVVRSALIKEIGGFRSGLDGSQDHDLWLRISAKSEREQIVHIQKILYHWRQHEKSTARESSSKPYAWDAGQRAVQSYFEEKYPDVNASVVKGEFPFTYKMKFQFESEPKVSIIIPTRDGVELLKVCVDGILKRTNWKNLEIIILDNGSIKPETFSYFELIQMDARVSVFREDIEFNWSRLNNIGAQKANGEYFIFLNNDTDVTQPDWIDSLVGYASLPDVGLVGALLLFEDGTIQHSGVVVGMGGWADHVYRTCPPSHFMGLPFISPVITRNVLAVTGACMVIGAQKFEEMGGFDEAFRICGSDVELGIRSHKQGYFNVLCADVRLYHYESKTRSPHVPDNDFVQSDLKYKPYRKEIVDPFYNGNLRLDRTKPEVNKG